MKKPETDSIPRVTVRDLFMVLQVFDRTPETLLENIRLRICVDRKKQRRGSFLWSAARDTSAELVRLGLLEGACHAKNAQQYETMKGNKLRLTKEGAALLSVSNTNRGAAYDQLFSRLVAKHPYLQQFTAVISKGDLLAPVISSMRDHVCDRYAANAVLASDIAEGSFEYDCLLEKTAARLGRALDPTESKEIVGLLEKLVADASPSAACEDTTAFAKTILNKLNDIIVPAVFRKDGLGFDFRSHRTIWAMGQEFRVWAVARSHPKYDVCLIYLTSTLELSKDGSRITTMSFDYGLKKTGERFLEKLHNAYQALSALRGISIVSAWELRAVFCLENRCQPTVFDKLFSQWYAGSSEYKLHLEIQRQKPQHEEPIRAGGRNVGAIRVVKS